MNILLLVVHALRILITLTWMGCPFLPEATMFLMVFILSYEQVGDFLQLEGRRHYNSGPTGRRLRSPCSLIHIVATFLLQLTGCAQPRFIQSTREAQETFKKLIHLILVEMHTPWIKIACSAVAFDVLGVARVQPFTGSGLIHYAKEDVCTTVSTGPPEKTVAP